jgi:hypothetical protein
MALKKLPRSAGRRLCSFGKKQLRWLDLAVAHRQHFAEDNAIDRGEVVLLQASMISSNLRDTCHCRIGTAGLNGRPYLAVAANGPGSDSRPAIRRKRHTILARARQFQLRQRDKDNAAADFQNCEAHGDSASSTTLTGVETSARDNNEIDAASASADFA